MTNFGRSCHLWGKRVTKNKKILGQSLRIPQRFVSTVHYNELSGFVKGQRCVQVSVFYLDMEKICSIMHINKEKFAIGYEYD
jgi:hypothetical protein